MGSWNETCGLSNLPISPGEKVVFLMLTKNPHEDHVGRSGCYHTDFFFVRSIPLYGVYDDYGKVAIDSGQDAAIDLIKQGFALDLISQPADKYRHGPISMDTWTIDEVQDWLHEGKVRIDRNTLGRKSDEEMAKITASLALKSDDPGTAKQSKETKKILAERQKVVPSPIYKLIIRRDVWDAFLTITCESWYGKYSLAEYKAGADAVLARYAEKLNSPPDEFDSLTKHRSIRSMLLLSDVGSKSDNPFVSRFFSVGGGGDPPFEVSNKWYCEKLSDRMFDRTVTIEEVRDIFYKLCELAQVEHIMAKTRRAWQPTTGMGSQSEEYELALEVFTELARVTEAAILKGIEERREWDEDEAEEASRRFQILKNRLGS